MKNKEVVIPIITKRMTASSYDPFHPTQAEYKRVTRRYSTIEKQLNALYKKINKALEDGFTPTHLIVNELDYKFFKAYWYYYHKFTYLSPIAPEINTIFGLKVLITQAKRPSVAWES